MSRSRKSAEAEILGVTDTGAPSPANDQISTQNPRWCTPLANFIGDEEPDEDDSVDWVIRNIVPRGEPVIWGGPPKSGKTWALLDLGISMATGKAWLGGIFENTFGRRARVLSVALEDSARRLRNRIWQLARGHGIDPRDLHEHMCVTQMPVRFQSPEEMAAFTNELRQWRPDVVLIDNLTRIFIGDPNATKDATSFSNQWANLCQELGCAVVLLHHTGKGTGDGRDAFDALRGSGVFQSTPRNMIVSRPADMARRQVTRIRIRGNLELTTDEVAIEFEMNLDADGRRVATLKRADDVVEANNDSTGPVAQKLLERLQREPAGFAHRTAWVEATSVTRQEGFRVAGILVETQVVDKRRGRICAPLVGTGSSEFPAGSELGNLDASQSKLVAHPLLERSRVANSNEDDAERSSSEVPPPRGPEPGTWNWGNND